MYGHVITKFSWKGSLPHFLTHGVPQACFARQRFAKIGLFWFAIFTIFSPALDKLYPISNQNPFLLKNNEYSKQHKTQEFQFLNFAILK